MVWVIDRKTKSGISFCYCGNFSELCNLPQTPSTTFYLQIQILATLENATYCLQTFSYWLRLKHMAGFSCLDGSISSYSSVLCSYNFTRSLCIPAAGGLTFCLSEKVKIAPLQGSLAASVFPFLFVGNWKCSETG